MNWRVSLEATYRRELYLQMNSPAWGDFAPEGVAEMALIAAVDGSSGRERMMNSGPTVPAAVEKIISIERERVQRDLPIRAINDLQ
jgi:hypothetical protein